MDRWLTSRIRNFVLFSGLFASLCAGQRPRALAITQDQVKAAYLFDFTKFVEWPATAFATPSDPIRLCILNDPLFKARLIQIADNRLIAGRPVNVILVHDARESRNCHELFIDSSQSQDASQVIDSLRGVSVLTVGENENFVRQGGIINFVVLGEQVQFQVNQKAATLAGLHMSSQLLTVARRVFK